MKFFTQAWSWVQSRLAERSTYDGTVIVAVSVAAFLTAPFVKYIAAIGIIYGILRISQQEVVRSDTDESDE